MLTNDEFLVEDVMVYPNAFASDHHPLIFKLHVRKTRPRNAKRKVYIKKKADCQRIKRELQSLAEAQAPVTGDASVDEKWNYFEENIRRIMETCIPHKMTSSRYNLP